MDLKSLKQRIYDEEKIEPLLESLECENIHREQNKSLICAKLPDRFESTNLRSIQIKNNENLTSYIRSRDISGDIFAIIGFILYDTTDFEQVKERLFDIVAYICNEFNYDINNDFENPKKKDWNYFLRPVKQKRKNELILDSIPQNIELDKNIMNQYIPYLHINWFNEGISQKSRDKYHICYDLRTERIVFPIFNNKNQIISVKGRYAGEDENQIKFLYLYNFYKSIELFNLNFAKDYIQYKKQGIVLESEKGCMLADQWGIKNTIAISGSDLSPYQIYKMKQLGMDIEWIFMFDADKDEDFVLKQIKQIKNRKIKYLKTELLSKDEKESPTDRGKEVFLELLNNHLVTI